MHKLNFEEIRFKFKEGKNELKIVLSYFLKEPFFELKKIIMGYSNSTLSFWASVILYIYLWRKNIGGINLKVAGILVLISYFYLFYKSKRWKEYYEQEFVKGGKIV